MHWHRSYIVGVEEWSGEKSTRGNDWFHHEVNIARVWKPTRRIVQARREWQKNWWGEVRRENGWRFCHQFLCRSKRREGLPVIGSPRRLRKLPLCVFFLSPLLFLLKFPAIYESTSMCRRTCTPRKSIFILPKQPHPSMPQATHTEKKKYTEPVTGIQLHSINAIIAVILYPCRKISYVVNHQLQQLYIQSGIYLQDILFTIRSDWQLINWRHNEWMTVDDFLVR